MKKLMLVAMLLLMTMISGCGSEISVVLPIYINSPPEITSLHHTQDVVNSYVDGTVGFDAPDVDLDTITIIVVDSWGVEVEHTVKSLGSFAGRSSGVISFTIDYIDYYPDDYTFTIYLIDRDGYMSNAVYGSFRV